MKSKNLFYCQFLFLILYINNLSAQTVTPDVINSAGSGTYVAGSTNIEVAVGESLISTLSDSNSFITQGFLQPRYNIITGILNIDNNSYIRIFPVPATSNLYIEYKNIRIKQVRVVDILGRIVFSANTGINSIITSGLPAGLYILNVFTDRSSQHYDLKFIKQ